MWVTLFFKLILENQTACELTIYVNDHKVGNVSPGERMMDDIPITITKFHIEGRNPQGEIVFSETLTREQMQKIESLVYKVVIPPLQKGIENSDNVTEK